jgi:hypothetical protein
MMLVFSCLANDCTQRCALTPGQVGKLAIAAFAYVRDLVLEDVLWRLDHLQTWDTVAAEADEVISACDFNRARQAVSAMKGDGK